ncbi:MAG: hypothetical protein ACKOIA_05530 [Acidimicrobiia bacterium]
MTTATRPPSNDGRRARLLARWAPVAVWLSLPLTAGPTFGDALADRSAAVVLVAAVGLWAGWAGGLVAALVPSTASLTAVRILFPAALVAAVWAAILSDDPTGTAASFALAVTSLAAVLSRWAMVGDVYVTGSSYGDERRFPLRPPGPVVLGPLEVLWAVMVAATFAGPLLLAARQWVPGVVLTVIAVAVDIIGVRALHQLSRRWLVFVPAGVVLVDRSVLLEAMLTLRPRIESMGLAAEDSEAVDLSNGAIGLQVELRLDRTGDIVRTPARRDRHLLVEPVEVTAVRFSPSRPGQVLDAARARRITVE